MKKTAIILNGNIRTWQQTKDSFKKVFAPLEPDVYLSTYDMQFSYHPYIQKSVVNDDTDNILTEGQIINMFTDINLKDFMIESSNVVSELNTMDNQKMDPSMKSSDNTYAQIRKLRLGLNLIKNEEDRFKFRYDYIIKTRCDLIYDPNMENCWDVILKNADEGNIIVSTGNIFPNDCIYVGQRDDIMKMVDFMYYEFFRPIFKDSNKQPPHGLLANAAKVAQCNINQAHFIDYVLRKGNLVQYY
jgi:hypothetical protein